MFAYFERDSFGARAEDAGRSCSLAARTLFEPLLADDVETDGHMGLTNSIRHVGPPTNSADSDFTKAGASPPTIQTCESGGVLPSTEAIAPVTPGTCTFST